MKHILSVSRLLRRESHWSLALQSVSRRLKTGISFSNFLIEFYCSKTFGGLNKTVSQHSWENIFRNFWTLYLLVLHKQFLIEIHAENIEFLFTKKNWKIRNFNFFLNYQFFWRKIVHNVQSTEVEKNIRKSFFILSSIWRMESMKRRDAKTLKIHYSTL